MEPTRRHQPARTTVSVLELDSELVADRVEEIGCGIEGSARLIRFEKTSSLPHPGQ
jgi:hypothetical protein